MEVRLSPGESLFVAIADSDYSDDGIRIEYDVNRSDQIVVTASYEDDRGRQGEIYCATLDDDPRVDGNKSTDDRNAVVKTISCSSCGTSFKFTKGEEIFMRKVFQDNYKDPVRCPRCRKIRMSRRMAEIKVDVSENHIDPVDDVVVDPIMDKKEDEE